MGPEKKDVIPVVVSPKNPARSAEEAESFLLRKFIREKPPPGRALWH
jgi:hypothetical protein